MPKSSFSWPCSRLEEVAYELGDEFIAYCLDLPRLPQDESSLSPNKRQVLEEVSNLVTSMRLTPLPIRALSVSEWLTTPNAEGLTPPQVWRIQSDGVLPVVTSSEDGLLTELAKVGLQVFPYKALAEPYVGEGSGSFSRVAVPMSKRSELARLIVRDRSLGQLFGDTPPDVEISESDLFNRGTTLYFNNGNGFGVQAIMLPESILNNAFASLLLTNVEEAADFGKFEEHLSRVLEESRALARREVVKVVRVVGFHGVQLEESLAVGEFRIRPTRPTDTLAFNQISTGGYASAVLEARRPLQILAADADLFEPPEGESDPFAKTRPHQEEVERSNAGWTDKVENVRLACALSSPDYESMIAPVVLFEAELNPLSHSQSLAYRLVPVSFHPQVKLDRVRAGKATEWLGVVGANISPSIRIAGRRLLTALTERSDPTDAFVDALVAWESLFGTGTEVSFRVSAALAALLEPVDMDARRAVYKELKRLYGLRSRLVHGSADLAPSEAETHRRRACEVALQATQRVLKTATLAPMKAEERSDRLLFGI